MLFAYGAATTAAVDDDTRSRAADDSEAAEAPEAEAEDDDDAELDAAVVVVVVGVVPNASSAVFSVSLIALMDGRCFGSRCRHCAIVCRTTSGHDGSI